MKQQSLFPNIDDSLKKSSSLVLSKFKNKILSKEQSLFNKYSKKIELLRNQIESEQLKYENLVKYFITKVEPEQKSYADALIEFVKQLFIMYKHEKLTNIAKEKLSLLIISNLKSAFKFVVPSDDVKAIYDSFNDTSYDEEESEQIDMMKDSMGDMFSEMFGTNIDFSDMDMSEEGMAKKLAEMKEIFENQEKNSPKTKSRKKTKREIDFEIKKKQAEELQNKNIRSIYTSLAKMLHPDLELDEMKRLEKEELMKKVTNAYHEKDLHTLLKLEIEIIHKENENLEHLTDEKLKLLNIALKEQVDELEEEKEMQKHHPKYENIGEFMHFPEKRATQQIDNYIREIIDERNGLEWDLLKLKERKGVQFLTQMLKQINLPNSFNKNFDFDFDDDFDDDLNENELNTLLDFIINKGKSKKKNK